MGRTRRGFKRLPVRMWVTFYAITLPVPVVHKQCKFRYAGHFWQRFFISWINGAIFYLHDVNFWLSCFGPSFRYNLVTIGVLEFVVVIDVYAQPTREKIKFYRTASNTTVELAGRSGVWRSVVSSGRLWRRPDGPGARATMRE